MAYEKTHLGQTEHGTDEMSSGWTCRICSTFKTWDELIEETYSEDRENLFEGPTLLGMCDPSDRQGVRVATDNRLSYGPIPDNLRTL